MKQITTSEAVRILGCDPKALQRLKKEGSLQAKKIGREWFFNETDILSLKGKIKGRTTYRPIKKIETNQIDKSQPLTTIGLQVLADLTKEIENNNTYKEVDKHLIFAAALAFQRAMEYEGKAMELDYTSIQPNGAEKEHHFSVVADKSFKRYVMICDKLGITPTTRKKTQAPEPQEPNPFAEFFE